MSELEIEGSWEEQWGIMKSAVKQHHAALNGNGQPGLVDFATGLRAQLRLLLWLVTLFGVLSALGTVTVAVLEYNRQAQRNMIHMPQFFHPDKQGEVYSAHSGQQTAIKE